MKKTLLAIAALSFATASALAQQSPWLVRARMVDIGFDVSNQTSVAGLSAKDKTIPEVDITYFFNPNVAAELILTVPQKHDVTVGGAAVGTFKHLPPHLDGAIPLYAAPRLQALRGRGCELHQDHGRSSGAGGRGARRRQSRS